LTSRRLSRGKQAELLALDYLLGNGLELLHQNYYCRGGELDLVMREGKALVFVEVRLRTSAGYGSAAESITAGKRDKIRHAALHFMANRPELAGLPARFDVIALSELRIDDNCWIRNAFDA
jgi:putative endonuclease